MNPDEEFLNVMNIVQSTSESEVDSIEEAKADDDCIFR